MSRQSLEILVKHWGYASFRPMQEEIVDAVIAQRDTLALLPTGGGKSICFQVPGMAMPGLCLVVTPLIALMKDQVMHLKQKGIAAAAIFSGMHPNEIEIAYNHAAYGQLKFLYVSPERLLTERFIMLIQRVKINLIAVDESHCISQWGYDFRPPYLRIAEIRPYLPGIPLLALTATATPIVVKDIQAKLMFRQPHVIQTSFVRTNLTYNIIHHPDKFGTLERLLQRMSYGSGIVYVRNRRRTREISDFLNSRGITSTWYHAGLEGPQRDERQTAWMRGKVKVIVATNAFGMGIDKPDVRLVVHMDLPDSLEAYFQEAGRGGRDGKEAYAWLLTADQDVHQLKSGFEAGFPEPQKIRAIYQALGNYFQLPIGSGQGQSFDFDLPAFSKDYNFQVAEAFAALQFFEKEGFMQMTEGVRTSARLFVQCSREDLYRFQVEQPAFDGFIKNMLRSFPGLFTDFVPIRIEEIARKTDFTSQRVEEYLNKMMKLGFLTYIPVKDKPQVIYLSARQPAENIFLSKEHYFDRKKNAAQRLQSVIDFVYNNDECRSIQLLRYFGEEQRQRCGKCDVCIKRNKMNLSDVEFESIKSQLLILLDQRPYPLFEALPKIEGYKEEKILMAIRWMLENRLIEKDSTERLTIKKQLGFDSIW